MRKAFTLVEVLVGLVIFGLLFVLLMRVYISSSNIYMHQNYQKILEKELLFINQNLQNLADEYTIDYSNYQNLEEKHGFIEELYLHKKLDGAVIERLKISMVGDCESEEGCYLEMDKNGVLVPLTNKNLTKISKFKMKLNPYQDPYSLTFEEEKRRQPYITLFMDLKIKDYNENIWMKKVGYDIQEGFNFKYYGK